MKPILSDYTWKDEIQKELEQNKIIVTDAIIFITILMPILVLTLSLFMLLE